MSLRQVLYVITITNEPPNCVGPGYDIIVLFCDECGSTMAMTTASMDFRVRRRASPILVRLLVQRYCNGSNFLQQ
jgi:hypothetical protein